MFELFSVNDHIDQPPGARTDRAPNTCNGIELS